MDQHTQRFGLISGHLRRLVESAGWGEVPKASCSSTAHLPVGRKHFSAQLAYHGGDERCCSRADPTAAGDGMAGTSLCLCCC